MAITLFDSTHIPSKGKDQIFEINVIDLKTKQINIEKINVPFILNESLIDKVKFKVFKFNNRPRPQNKKRILVISCFSEFGCETIGCMYGIPRLIQKNKGSYLIGIGWHGREFLYRRLFDEFWEIDENYMWLRDYCRAFHHVSNNLKNIEETICRYGAVVVPSSIMGRYAVGNMCRTCGKFWYGWEEKKEECGACGSTLLVHSIFSDIENNKKRAIMPPAVSDEIKTWAKTIVKPNTVGIFARNRVTYGRNLNEEFYKSLIKLLESKGYNIIWLGEKQNVLKCPCDHVFDFSSHPEARDLEKVLAVISELSFTVQFWTASTRLAGMVGTPFLLFESPDQVYSTQYSPGQEGKRLELTTFGLKKLCICDYKPSCDNLEKLLDLVKVCVEQMEQGDFSEVQGIVSDEKLCDENRKLFYERLK